MFAKQTLSASLVALLAGGGSSVPAYADPGDPPPAPAADDEAPHHTGSFTIGAGYDSDEGFVALARIAQTDLFHTGLRLSMDALVSERRQLFDLRFADPHVAG